MKEEIKYILPYFQAIILIAVGFLLVVGLAYFIEFIVGVFG